MKRRKLYMLGAAVAAASLMTGCTTASSGAPSAGGTTEIPFWSPQAGAGPAETANMKAMIADFNASQSAYKVTWKPYPFDSYNTTVQSAATAKKLPCLLAVDQPVVPSWAWAGYLAPLNLSKDLTSGLVPGAKGEYNGQLYSVGYWDAALSMMARKSVLNANGIRIPTLDQPWTKDEFSQALAKLKATGKYKYPLLLGNPTGQGASYPFATFLWSFGGDLINRSDYKSADGALNGAKAVAFGTWLQNLAKDGMISKSNVDGNPFLDGKVALTFDGNWNANAVIEKFKDDVLFLPPPDFGNGPKIGAGSIGFGVSTACTPEQKKGAEQYLAMTLDPKYIVKFADTQGVVPSTAEAADRSKDYGANGRLAILAQLLQKASQTRPATPAFPAIDTAFNKAVGDIISGSDVKSSLDDATKAIDADIQQNDGYQKQ